MLLSLYLLYCFVKSRLSCLSQNKLPEIHSRFRELILRSIYIFASNEISLFLNYLTFWYYEKVVRFLCLVRCCVYLYCTNIVWTGVITGDTSKQKLWSKKGDYVLPLRWVSSSLVYQQKQWKSTGQLCNISPLIHNSSVLMLVNAGWRIDLFTEIWFCRSLLTIHTMGRTHVQGWMFGRSIKKKNWIFQWI